ncbi:MAG: thiolase C-terminal domain-containing protein [Nitrososphaerota archaeon]
MNKVAVVGYGNTKFSSEDTPIESLLVSATKSLFDQTKNIEQKNIDVVLVSTNDNTKYLSAILSELTGISPKIAHTVENLCSSGTNSIVSAYSYIVSGLADVALVVGADRYDCPGQILEWDSSRGEFKHPVFWASIFTKAYKREFGTTQEDLAVVSAKNHNNARFNPHAYSDKTYSIDEILQSKFVTDDLHLLDCSRPCSGASSVLLASENVAKKFEQPVWIKGIGQKTTSASITKNENLTTMTSTKIAARQAFDMAKIQVNDIDVTELHDAFTICEIMALEDIGFVKKGTGSSYVRELYDTQNNEINPRGGLIGSGHPLGATGIAQVVEITQQLHNKAEKRQSKNASVGLVHNMSAAATSSTVLLLQS